MTPYNDALALVSILVAEHPTDVLEIGTYMGTPLGLWQKILRMQPFTRLIYLRIFRATRIVTAHPKDDHHLIVRRVLGREFKGQLCEERIVRQHFGDTAIIDFARIGRPTFFFIDGTHTYEHCKSDSEKCLAVCPHGGTVFWHDCDELHPGVVKFVSEWPAHGKKLFAFRNEPRVLEVNRSSVPSLL